MTETKSADSNWKILIELDIKVIYIVKNVKFK